MPELHNTAVALGSNLPSKFGAPADNLREAIARITTLGQVKAVSSFLTTAPEIYAAQPNFVNAALLLETALPPLELMRALLAIELAMGRVRTGVPPKGPRLIDLDLIFYDDLVLDSPGLTLPHPALASRRFVLAPLAEIAPNLIDPVTNLTIAALLSRLQ